jgi:hypothetical protein
MPGHYTKSLKKKLLKKPDSIKPKMIMVSKSYKVEPDTNKFKINRIKMEPLEPVKLKKKKKKKGKEAAVISNRLKRMKEGSLYTK